VRANIARLLHTRKNSIYFTTRATSSFENAIGLLNLKKGDEIITTTEEYDSIDDIMDEQCETGIRVKKLSTRGDLLGRIKSNISWKTKAVVVSHITHDSCKVLPVKEISEMCHKEGTLLVLDVTHSVGQIPVDISYIRPNIAIFGGHKWLRGEETTGILYVDREFPGLKSLDRSTPFAVPLKYMKRLYGQGYEHHINMEIESGGLGNTEQILHLGNALKEFERLGWGNVFARIAWLGENARDLLRDNKYVKILNNENPAPGMISIQVRGMDQREAMNELKRLYHIDVTPKPHEDPQRLRISISAFNTLPELRILDTTLYIIGKGDYK
jgi:selenocysteine lyase/cysteine desulfurase